MHDSGDVPIETMPAGRALDALVTEKVMNWHVPSSTDIAWLMSVGTNTDGAAMLSLVPPYSTRIAAAWQVADRFGLSVLRSANGWVAGIIEDDFPENGFIDCGIMHTALADTAPLAICRAALAAVAVQTTPSR